MSCTNNDRKSRSISGNDLPAGPGGGNEGGSTFASSIAAALKREYGGTHASVKTVVGLTRANERAVKNWFSAKNGPSGHHLVALLRASDEVLKEILLMADRHAVLAQRELAEARPVLRQMVRLLDKLAESGHI